MNGRRSRQLKVEDQYGVRRWAVEQVVKGGRVEDVAAGLDYNRSTVFGWMKRYGEDGLSALNTKARSGRPPKGPSLDRVDFGVLSGSPWVDLSNLGSLSGRGGVRRDRW